MSYRRVRSYRRRDARRYRDLPGRPRPGLVPMAMLLAVALAAGIATLSAPHIKAMLSAATTAEQLRAAATADGLRTSAKPGQPRTAAKAAGLPEACAAP